MKASETSTETVTAQNGVCYDVYWLQPFYVFIGFGKMAFGQSACIFILFYNS